MRSVADAAYYLPRQTQSATRHGHPNTTTMASTGFSPLARSTMQSNTNTNANLNGFVSQMGGNRPPTGPSAMSHAHTRSDPRARPSNPPTAPAAMRAGVSGGSLQQRPNGDYYRPNYGPSPTGTSMQAANNIQRKMGGQGLVNTGLGDRWYMR